MKKNRWIAFVKKPFEVNIALIYILDHRKYIIFRHVAICTCTRNALNADKR